MGEFSVTVTEAVCLGTSLALSGICYYLFRRSQAKVDHLDRAPHLPVDENLKSLLSVTPGECLQYAVIEGTVKPVGEPLKSHFHKDVLGVLQKFTLREYRLLWDSFSRSWVDNDLVLHERASMVPFVLVGSDETTVRVLCPLHASGDYMEMIHEKFQHSVSTFGELAGQYFSGVKPKGQLEIEKMLKVGTTLTGIGELIIDTDGNMSLQPPTNSAEYLLSIRDFATLREETMSSAFWWKLLLNVSALAGVAILLRIGLRYYSHLETLWRKKQEQREYEQLMSDGLTSTGRQDGQDNQEGNNCVICLSQPRNCVLLDCGHVCCCQTCYQALPQQSCPICRQAIVRVLPLFQT